MLISYGGSCCDGRQWKREKREERDEKRAAILEMRRKEEEKTNQIYNVKKTAKRKLDSEMQTSELTMKYLIEIFSPNRLIWRRCCVRAALRKTRPKRQ